MLFLFGANVIVSSVAVSCDRVSGCLLLILFCVTGSAGMGTFAEFAMVVVVTTGSFAKSSVVIIPTVAVFAAAGAGSGTKGLLIWGR